MQIVKGEIWTKDWKRKHKFFEERSTDIHKQKQLSLLQPWHFLKDIKTLSEKGRSLKLKIFAIRQTIVKLLTTWGRTSEKYLQILQ